MLLPEKLTEGLTREQMIGQLFMGGFPGTEPTPELIELIERHGLGGVILFSRNCHDAAQIADLTARLQEVARAAGHRAPLLISTDQENGLVRRLGPDATPLPGNMALGAAGSEALVAEVAEATGQELRALGINMNLAPVADVNNNPANPVIGTRAFGEDPERVARLVVAAVRGYHSAGVIATLKHFPGHGDTATDSHQALPIVPHDLERLRAVELVPFRAGIAAGVDCVLTAHVALPRLTGGDPRPATLAPEAITDLLRRELGFDGVVVTDCLEMRAISETVGTAEGAVAALRAGSDVVLVSHRYDRQIGAIAAVRAAVESGALAAETLVTAAERVLRLKRHYLAWERLPTAQGRAIVGSAAHRALSDRAYACSTTLVRDDDGVLPLRLAPQQRILVAAQVCGPVSQAVDAPYDPRVFVEALRREHAATTAITFPATPSVAERTALRDAASAADVVILLSLNAHLDPPQAAVLRDLISTARHPVIGIAVGDPYDLAALPGLRTYLATYEYTAPALEAAARALFGQAPPLGRAPVTLLPS